MPRTRLRRARLVSTLLVALALCAGGAVRADWLVYVGGEVEETSGAWQVRGRQLRFTALSGQLQSIGTEEVDLASSAFLTAQLGTARASAAGGESPAATPPGAQGAVAEAPCVSGRAVRLAGVDRIEVDTGRGVEIVRLACFDAPEKNARLEPIVHYVEALEREAARLLVVRPAVCYESDAASGERDHDGHRIAYLRLADGRDLGAELIRRGFAIGAPGGCARAEEYRRLERDAATAQRGLWVAATTEVARAIAAGLPRFSKAKRPGRP